MSLAGAHADRPVVLDEWQGRRVAVKHYRRGSAEQVARTMTALWQSAFGRDRSPPGLPQPLALEGSRLAMELVPGRPAGGRGSLGATERIAGAAAALLADLHGSGIVVERVRSGTRIARSLERKLDDLPEAELRRSYAAALDALDPRALDGELVVSHGDFSPRNVLLAPEGPRLIDFDRCQMAPRARDLAYWGAWAWATLALAGSEPRWRVGDRFEAAYLERTASPAPAEERRAAHRAAALLRIAHGWSALRRRPGIAARVVEEARRQLAG